jgi:hypothetical protein
MRYEKRERERKVKINKNKRIIVATIFLALFLTACGGGSSAVDESTDSSTTSVRGYTKLDKNTYLNENDDVILYISSDLNKSSKLIYDSDKVEEITKHIYQYVEDKYDFIFLITNNTFQPSTVTYAGVFSKVKNDVEGIGVDIYSNSHNYGSKGMLKGIMHFAYRKAILGGPTLHEICHYWANKFNFNTKEAPYYLFGSPPHWGRVGFFGGKGQLGGYDANTFRDENKTYTTRKGDREIFSADYFGVNANGGNGIPYNDVELYLMGMIPLNDVKDLLIPIKYGSALSASDANDSGVDVDYSRKYFIAEEVERKSLKDILNEHNIVERRPSSTTSQKKFKILTVLLDTKMPKHYQVKNISVLMNNLAYKGDDGKETNFNFYEATRGKGSLDVAGISKTFKTPQTNKIELSIDYTPQTIEFHGLEYKTVESPYTGRVWLDRNIGATRVCENVTDSACFGDYFAFGRGMDGHEKADSNYTNIKASSIDNAGDEFIYVADTSSNDWMEAGVDDKLVNRAEFFSRTDGSGVCPIGFRVPTKDEITYDTYYNERLDDFQTLKDAEKNFLKLPAAGYRNAFSKVARVVYDTTQGFLWTSTLYTSSTTSEVKVKRFSFSDNGVTAYTTRYFADGMNIRCIKAEE